MKLVPGCLRLFFKKIRRTNTINNLIKCSLRSQSLISSVRSYRICTIYENHISGLALCDAFLESGFMLELLILFEPFKPSTILTKLQFFVQGWSNFCLLRWDMKGLLLPSLLCLYMATCRIHTIGSPIGQCTVCLAGSNLQQNLPILVCIKNTYIPVDGSIWSACTN